MIFPSLLDSDKDPERKPGNHIVDVSLKNYFNSFPPESKMREVINHAFVIHKPLGEVGGDGYWLHENADGSFLILVFDCMGHGRLASVMTRVYLEAIDQVVKVQGVTEPAGILQGIHDRVSDRFQNKPNTLVGSGADMAVLKIDLKNEKAYFSGAKIDLIFVQNDQIHRIKSHKRQLGEHFQVKRQYETHEVPLVKNQANGFYLCTDGVVDLSGGPKDKKLGYKQLLPILFEAYSLPVDKSRAYVERQLTKWMGQHQLTDDLLVVGLKV